MKRPADTSGESAQVDADVAVVGSGLAGAMLAVELSRHIHVCLVSAPDAGGAELESDGYISAGYELTDLAAIGDARRGAAAWRLWARRHGLAQSSGPVWCALPDRELALREWRWAEAGLAVTESEAGPPRPFDTGPAASGTVLRLPDDLILEPQDVYRRLAQDLGVDVLSVAEADPLVFGEKVHGVEAVKATGEPVHVSAELVVLAAGVDSYRMLSGLAAHGSGGLRRTAYEQRRLGAVAQRLVLHIDGALPLVSGWFGPLRVAAHPAPDTSDVRWQVTDLSARPTVIDASRWASVTTPPTAQLAADSLAARLLALAPDLRPIRDQLAWAHRIDQGAARPAESGPGSAPLVTDLPPGAERPSLVFLPPVPPNQLVIQVDAALERILDRRSRS